MSGFKRARERSGMTQQQLADVLGVDQSTVCLWETGKTFPRGKMLTRVASICNCTVDELLTSFEGGIESGEAEQNGHSADP